MKPVKTFLFVTIIALSFHCGSCAKDPRTAQELISEMAELTEGGHYDSAIKLGERWLNQHPNEKHLRDFVCGQLAILYLHKASLQNNDEVLITKAEGYLDSSYAILTNGKNAQGDIGFYDVGRGFEAAGDLSKQKQCFYYARAMNAFKDQILLLEGNDIQEYGHTFRLEPVRQENQKALERVKSSFQKANCK